MGNNVSGNLACSKCKGLCLLELLSNENGILLRQYCFCGESTKLFTTIIDVEIVAEFKFYKRYDCNNCSKSINKYCYTCDYFYCKNCLKSHLHKRVLDPKYFFINCIYHTSEKLVGFCKKCKVQICNTCIKYFHFNHEIKYTKDLELEINNDIINNYNNNLMKLFNDYKNYVEIKYGKDTKIELTCLVNDFRKNIFFDKNDKLILKALTLLKHFIDLYDYYKNSGEMQYPIIANLMKHTNCEIIHLPGGSGDKTENIYLKINLKNEENRKNEICLDLNSRLINQDWNNITKFANKLIKLNNGNIASSCEGKKIRIKYFIMINILTKSFYY